MNWTVSKSQDVIDKHELFIDDCYKAHEVIAKRFPDQDSTSNYQNYNIFSVTSPKRHWYNLYKQLCQTIRQTVGTDEPLWVQTWLNFHDPDTVLDWHAHEYEFHGYISIDPKSTTTLFGNGAYEIKNEVGNIYLGQGYIRHKVQVDEFFEGKRITLGFDVMNRYDEIETGRNMNLGLYPV